MPLQDANPTPSFGGFGLRERRDTSILLVEQSLDFALGVADHCFLMEKGEIVLEGATNTLDQNLMRDYLAV